MARKVAVAVLALVASAAVAQDSFLSSLPTCSTLDGTEYVYMEQALGVAAKKCSTLAFSALFGISLDLGNDSVLESTRLRSIQTSGDTNSIFTEAPADELLIDLSKDWPKADLADALAADGANCAAGNYPLGVDATGAVQDCTAAGGGGGDNLRVEDADNAGTFTAMVDADFDDSGDINFIRAAGPPDVLTATVRADAVALTTDTTGNYAAGDAEAGAALTGDSATAFFAAGTLEDARVDGSLEADEVNPTLGTQTQGDYVADVTANQGLLKTGTEAATLGLIDCAENQILKNTGVGGTAWTCATDLSGGSATIVVEEDNATVDAAVTNLDFTEPDATLVTSSPAGEANVDMSKYALLAGRSVDQTIQGNSGADGTLYLRGSSATADEATLDINRLTGGASSFVHMRIDGGVATTADYYFNDTLFNILYNSNETARIDISTGDIGTDACVRIGQSDSGANSACLCRKAATDALYHDTSCDNTMDIGEDDLSVDDDVPESGDYGSLALTGDVTSSGLATTIGANTVALGTDTTGNYVDAATASQGLLLTGTEGASLGLIDCAAGETLSRNTADNAWACRARTGYALTVLSTVMATMTDSVSIYFGGGAAAPSTTTALRRVYIPTAGTITKAFITAWCTTAGTAESWTMNIRLNNSTDTAIQALLLSNTWRVWSNTGLSIAVAASDYIEIKSTHPAWATNPASCTFGGSITVAVP